MIMETSSERLPERSQEFSSGCENSFCIITYECAILTGLLFHSFSIIFSMVKSMAIRLINLFSTFSVDAISPT